MKHLKQLFLICTCCIALSACGLINHYVLNPLFRPAGLGSSEEPEEGWLKNARGGGSSTLWRTLCDGKT